MSGETKKPLYFNFPKLNKEFITFFVRSLFSEL